MQINLLTDTRVSFRPGRASAKKLTFQFFAKILYFRTNYSAMFPLPVFPALLWTFLPEPPSSLAHHWTHKVVLNVLPLCKSVKVSTDDWGLLFRPIIGWYFQHLSWEALASWKSVTSIAVVLHLPIIITVSDQNIFINSSLTESPPCAAPTTKYTWSTTPGENTWWCCDWCAGNYSWSGPLRLGAAQHKGSANILSQLRRHFSRMFGWGWFQCNDKQPSPRLVGVVKDKDEHDMPMK